MFVEPMNNKNSRNCGAMIRTIAGYARLKPETTSRVHGEERVVP
jgi:hypothetical protein